MDAIIQSRIDDLEDNILKDRELLKAYEDKERYESDPRKLVGIRREIERQRTSAARYWQEYQELVKEVESGPLETRKETTDELKRILSALTEIQSGQKVIVDELSETRETVLERLDTSEQAVIASIIKELDQNQLETVTCIWDALETNRIPEQEVKSTLDYLQELILDIKPHDSLTHTWSMRNLIASSNLNMVDMGSEGSFIFWDSDPVFKTSHQPLAYMDASLNAYGKMSLRGF